MFLAVDVGNSHMVLGVYGESRLICHWRVKTDRSSTADELASLFHGLFSMKEIHFSDINGVIIASVVPQMQSAWATFTKKYFRVSPLLVNGNVTAGMKILTDNPAEVGADRIVNAVVAYDQYRSPLIIVDFGTAITFDCVSGKGEYIGGVICPGLSISLEALGSRTAKLPRVDISSPPPQPIGKNTVDAIKSGILYGYGSLVDGIIKRIKAQFTPEEPKVIATGGMAELIAPYTEAVEVVDPMLTLEGLRLLYERNN